MNEKIKEILRMHAEWLAGGMGEKADLYEADLSGADLRGVNLREANLKIFQAGQWTAYIQKNEIRIGCQSHSPAEWESFADSQINGMHGDALASWSENKAIVLSIAKSIE